MVSRRILLKQEAEPSNAGAATDLVHVLVDETGIAAVRRLLGAAGAALPVLVSAHAYEREGFNAIPAVLARLLSERLDVPFDTTVVQTNVVGHTGAGGYGRLARQAAFGGEVETGREYAAIPANVPYTVMKPGFHGLFHLLSAQLRRFNGCFRAWRELLANT